MSEPVASTQRWAVGVEYDGSPFYGFQRQRQSPTVQACLEEALSRVADHPITIHASGRTDTGVHAFGQVVHFDARHHRDERAWLLGAQTHLHPGVAMRWVQPVSDAFHARYSARARHYRYRILNRLSRSAIDRDRAYWVHQPLDADAMQQAAVALLGEHDFTSFRAAGCQTHHAIRHVHALTVTRRGDEIDIDIRANAFLYHMVRNITGSLVLIGRGERPVAWLAELLEARDRSQSGMTAPAHGLYFIKALYEARWGLPPEFALSAG